MTHVVHGGLSAAERTTYAARGIDLVDLSASLNPYGPHRRVVAAARSARIDRYPEPDARSLRDSYAAVSGLDSAQVVAGNGSSDLIYHTMRAFALPRRPVLIAGPTFGEYVAAARAAGTEVLELRAEPAAAFSPDVSAILSAIASRRPAITVICNPNNPTGTLLARAEVRALTDAALAEGGRLLVDEAYGDFAFPCDERAGPAPGRIVLRSLTKLHAIPGLRLGFLLAEPADAQAVATVQAPWAVSVPAAAAGLQALKENAFARESRKRVALARDDLEERLASAGFSVTPSRANFLLVEVGSGPVFRARLMERGFVVRDCTSFGLPGHVRVAIPRSELVAPLGAAMEACQ